MLSIYTNAQDMLVSMHKISKYVLFKLIYYVTKNGRFHLDTATMKKYAECKQYPVKQMQKISSSTPINQFQMNNLPIFNDLTFPKLKQFSKSKQEIFSTRKGLKHVY